MAYTLFTFILIANSLLALCGDRLPVEEKFVAQTKWTDLRGRIVWRGKPIPQPMKAHAKDECCKKGLAVSENWVINRKNRGIRWVFVWLEPEPSGGLDPLPIHPSLKEVKPKTIILEQSGCRFVPHAFCLREGQKLHVKNKDAVAHNFRWVGHPKDNPGG